MGSTHDSKLQTALRRPRPVRPSTVWPCAQTSLQGGTGLISDWLLTAVGKIVTRYTRPGDRVLLIASPLFLLRSTQHRSTRIRTRTLPGPYDGLAEACWSIARLGRRVQIVAAAVPMGTCGVGPDDSSGASESGLGPGLAGHEADINSGLLADDSRGGGTVVAGPGPDRFDLIITAVEPLLLGRLDLADSVGRLAPTGLLTVITHGDRLDGWLYDPAGPLVHAAHRSGLRYLDRIALLRVPVRHSALITGSSAVRDQGRDSGVPSAASLRHLRVHEDLFLFDRGLLRRDEGTSDE